MSDKPSVDRTTTYGGYRYHYSIEVRSKHSAEQLENYWYYITDRVDLRLYRLFEGARDPHKKYGASTVYRFRFDCNPSSNWIDGSSLFPPRHVWDKDFPLGLYVEVTIYHVIRREVIRREVARRIQRVPVPEELPAEYDFTVGFTAGPVEPTWTYTNTTATLYGRGAQEQPERPVIADEVAQRQAPEGVGVRARAPQSSPFDDDEIFRIHQHAMDILAEARNGTGN